MVEPEAPVPLEIDSVGRIGPDVQRELLAQRDETIAVALDLLAVEIALGVRGIGSVEVVAAREYRIESDVADRAVDLDVVIVDRCAEVVRQPRVELRAEHDAERVSVGRFGLQVRIALNDAGRRTDAIGKGRQSGGRYPLST